MAKGPQFQPYVVDVWDGARAQPVRVSALSPSNAKSQAEREVRGQAMTVTGEDGTGWDVTRAGRLLLKRFGKGQPLVLDDGRTVRLAATVNQTRQLPRYHACRHLHTGPGYCPAQALANWLRRNGYLFAGTYQGGVTTTAPRGVVEQVWLRFVNRNLDRLPAGVL